MKKIENCPSTLREGYSTYCPKAVKLLIDGHKVSHVFERFGKRIGLSEPRMKRMLDKYEKKLTTYPRVATSFLSDDTYPKCPLCP